MMCQEKIRALLVLHFLIEQWLDKKTIITKILQLKIICSTCR